MKNLTMRFSIIWTFLFLSFISLAQEQKIDSLKAIIHANKTEDSTLANRLYLISNLFHKLGKMDSSDEYAKKALNVAETINFLKGEEKIYNLMGISAADRSDFNDAIDFYSKSLVCSRKLGDSMGVAYSHLNMGSVYAQQREYLKAAQYFLLALSSEEQSHDSVIISVLLSNLGGVYVASDDYQKGLYYLKQALKMDEKMKRMSGVANSLVGIGVLNIKEGNYDTALTYLYKSYEIDSSRKDIYDLSSVANDIGIAYANKKNYAYALYYYRKGIEISESVGDKLSIADFTGNIGTTYLRMRKYPEAEKYVLNALQIVNDLHNLDGEQEWYGTLSRIYDSTGEWKKAYMYYKNYSMAKDSLQNAANTKKMVSTELKYEYDKKRTVEKEEQQKKEVIEQSEKHKQKIITGSVTGGLILVLIFSAFILRSLSTTRRQKEIIEEKNNETEQQKIKLEEKQKEILDSITYAKRIQNALLASDNLLSTHLKEYFVIYKPKDIVSGDFYWATFRNNRFYFAVCDSTGHGVPGAFMSLLNISYLYEAITEKNIIEPNEILNHARRRLIDSLSQYGSQDGMDGVLLSLPLQIQDKSNAVFMEGKGLVLSYSAAYNAPIIVRDGTIIEPDADKMPIGASPREKESFMLRTLELKKGDMLYAFSDGFSDQFGGIQGKKFKHKQVLQTLLEINKKPVEVQKQELEQSFEKWKGNLEQVDDLLVVGIRI